MSHTTCYGKTPAFTSFSHDLAELFIICIPSPPQEVFWGTPCSRRASHNVSQCTRSHPFNKSKLTVHPVSPAAAALSSRRFAVNNGSSNLLPGRKPCCSSGCFASKISGGFVDQRFDINQFYFCNASITIQEISFAMVLVTGKHLTYPLVSTKARAESRLLDLTSSSSQ